MSSPPCIYEIIGVAGSGKSTLLRRLCCGAAAHLTVRDLVPSKFPWLRFSLRAAGLQMLCLGDPRFHVCQPDYAKMFTHMCWRDFFEIKSLARLSAYLWACQQGRISTNSMPYIMDQGPVFSLAFLEMLGYRRGSSVMRRVLDQQRERLKHSLKGLIFLQAPGELLEQRRHERGDWGIYKKHFGSVDNLNRLHAEYARIYSEIVEEFSRDMKVITINTMEHPADEVERVAREFISA